jgi:hypothetical protein
MTVRNEAGTELNQTTIMTHVEPVPAPEAEYTVVEPVYESYSLPGEGTPEMGNRLKWGTGSVIRQRDIDALPPAPAV